MTICPNDGLTLLPVTAKVGAGTYYTCSGCNNSFYGVGGQLLRSPVIVNGSVSMTSGLQITYVSHGLNTLPVAGEVIISLGDLIVAATSCKNFAVVGYSTQTFAIKTDVASSLIYSTSCPVTWQFTRA